jgi:hypothetical protein
MSYVQAQSTRSVLHTVNIPHHKLIEDQNYLPCLGCRDLFSIDNIKFLGSGVAHIVVGRPAVRQARVRFPSLHPFVDLSTGS